MDKMNKSNSEKSKAQDRAARKKSKRKKEPENIEPDSRETDITMDVTNEGGRSASRDRRSLSSLFRKSGDSKHRSRSRSESRDKSKAKSKAKNAPQEDNVETSLINVNPRIDPREHFRRMTVREALKESRARGRSPSRPTARLERTILEKSHRDSLSSSAPHLQDLLHNEETELDIKRPERVSGSTLPRTKRHRHRGHSADNDTQKRTKTENRDSMLSNHLPLDKRKYMINKDKIENSNQEMLSGDIDTVETHSNLQEPVSSTHVPTTYLQQEQSRRESFNQFLQLRDTIPNRHSSSSVSTRESAIDDLQFTSQTAETATAANKADNQPVVLAVKNNRESKINSLKDIGLDEADSEGEEFVDCCSSPTPESPHMDKESKTDGSKHIRFQQTIETDKPQNHPTLFLASNRTQNKNHETDTKLQQGVFTLDDTVTKPKQKHNESSVNKHESFRKEYVSPRRFSRASKASVKSDSSCASVVSYEAPNFPANAEISVENEIMTQRSEKPQRPKYQRHFSRKKSSLDATENELIPSSSSSINTGDHCEYLEKAPEQQLKGAKGTTTTPNIELKETNGADRSEEENVSIQIGSKTYIAAVSAFKALLGRSKRANGNKTSNANDPKSILENKTPHIKDYGSFEKESRSNAVPELVKESKTDNECQVNIVRPKFSLTSDNDNLCRNIKGNSNNKGVSDDDEVFRILQGETTDQQTNKNKTDKQETKVCAANLLPRNELLLEKRSASHDPSKQSNDPEKVFRRVSERSSDSEEYERRASLPVISDRLHQDSHSELIVDNKTAKAKSDLNISDRKEYETKPENRDTDLEKGKHLVDIKGKKGKEKHRKKKVKGKSKKKTAEVKKQSANEENDPALKSILKRHSVAQAANEDGNKKVEKVDSKRKLKRSKQGVAKAPLVSQRSTSLTDVRVENIGERDKKPRKSKSSSHIRSRSFENISTLEQKIERRKSKPSIDKGSAEASAKPPARLSIAAVVALKQKISRMRKAKQQKASEAKSEADQDNSEHNADDNVADNIGDGDKALIENEVNVSLGKLTVSSENDVIDDELENIYERKIKFDSYCPDEISEEELIKQRQRNTRLTSRRESKVRQRQKKVINCCKKFIAFLFSHIGLCSLMVGYSIVGGFIFQELEAPYEIQKNNEMETLRLTILQNIWDLAFEVTLNKGSAEVFKREVDAILKNYSQRIQRETKESGWDGDSGSSFEGGDIVKQAKLWSFPSSLLFAITVMTTIGYGHVAPKTDTGRIVTIAYALLGIPLTLLCLTNIGDVMAHGFRMLYAKVCCGVCCLLFRPSRRKLPDPEKGLQPEEQRMMMQEEEKSEEVIHVPTSLCILLMASYIMLGTLLFAKWEGWDPITGTYFCFITLSTIGFGDVVPGTDSDKWDEKEKLVLCAMYLVFGLSLIAMCFNLVQEDVKAKCRWLGMKLGIIDKPVSSV